jgi:hypothetical protein
MDGELEIRGFASAGRSDFSVVPAVHYSNIPFPLVLTVAGELGRLLALFEFQWRLNNETYMAALED